MTENNEITDLNSECGSSEPYALQVTDNSMEPEFPKDCIVIVDPSGSCVDGQYIFVEYDGVRWFRKFKKIDGDNLSSLSGFAKPSIGPSQRRSTIFIVEVDLNAILLF